MLGSSQTPKPIYSCTHNQLGTVSMCSPFCHQTRIDRHKRTSKYFHWLRPIWEKCDAAERHTRKQAFEYIPQATKNAERTFMQRLRSLDKNACQKRRTTMRRATHAGVRKQKCETTKSRTANDAHAPTNARQRSRNGKSHAKTIALSSQCSALFFLKKKHVFFVKNGAKHTSSSIF